MRCFVYALFDPRTNRIRYVGASTQGMKRPKQHWEPYYLNKEGHTHKARWIKSLLSLGLVPGVVVLEEVTQPSEAFTVESHWISELRSKGVNLTNLAVVGGSCLGCTRSLETREKMAAAKRGIRRPVEDRIKMSEAQKARKRPAAELEHMRALGQSWKGKTRSAETRAKMAEAKRGRKRPPEVVAKMAAALRGRKIDPEVARKISDALRGRPKTEETKQRMAEGQRRRWASRRTEVAGG